MVVGMCMALVFLFVPESFWDRSSPPIPIGNTASTSELSAHPITARTQRANTAYAEEERRSVLKDDNRDGEEATGLELKLKRNWSSEHLRAVSLADRAGKVFCIGGQDHLRSLKVLGEKSLENLIDEPFSPLDYSAVADSLGDEHQKDRQPAPVSTTQKSSVEPVAPDLDQKPPSQQYTPFLRTQPPKNFRQTLKIWNGRLRHEGWFVVALRPFILFAYPSIVWSTLVYSLSIGWLVVLSESVSTVYRDKESYNFSPLGIGLVYISPFIGGVLGTAVAGKLSDVMVRFMSRRNDGIYEPEFRLIMAIPVAISTGVGLMGFGWSVEERDRWIVPTVFFGIISFGCSLGSTTAIAFAVDSYQQYAGEALVTMNFSKSQFSITPLLGWSRVIL